MYSNARRRAGTRPRPPAAARRRHRAARIPAAALFADAGRTWDRDVAGETPLGWLSDVGVGLRIGNTRTGLGNVLHIDIAVRQVRLARRRRSQCDPERSLVTVRYQPGAWAPVN